MADGLNAVLRSSGLNPAKLVPLSDAGDRSLQVIHVPGGDASVKLWHKLHASLPAVGYSPVMLGEPDDLDSHRERLQFDARPATEVLAAAAKVDPVEYFRTTRLERLEDMASMGEDPSAVLPPEGRWPDKPQPSHRFSTPFHILTGKPHKELAVALVPTPRSWEVPAHLAFGGWNECPGDETHVAVLSHWNRLYGAEVLAMTSDVLELFVARPPTTRDEATAVARDVYVYCPDTVDQGVETIQNLASLMLNGSAWYFWWD